MKQQESDIAHVVLARRQVLRSLCVPGSARVSIGKYTVVTNKHDQTIMVEQQNGTLDCWSQEGPVVESLQSGEILFILCIGKSFYIFEKYIHLFD